MALENLFETAPRQADVTGLLPRAFAERTSKPAGYLVVGLHTRDFLDVSVYGVRSITNLTRPDNGAYHNNGVVHAVLQLDFSPDALLTREFYFASPQSEEAIRRQLCFSQNCGYSLPYDLQTLTTTSTDHDATVSVPSEQLAKHHRNLRPGKVQYVRRRKEDALVLPCPTLYYTTSLDEAQEAVRLLKQQALEY
ncbi:hypothetical protein HZC31_05925 [Candidatus Woesearchaeota archaeon]|nr:hypothetical protein [Candidatus Woesearchaeota archaeon]